MPVTIDGTSGITTPTYGGADTSEYIVPVTGFKNRIINGAMMIDQRNAGASVAVTNGVFLVDRWQALSYASGKYTAQQNSGSVTPPIGFSNYLGITSSSSYSTPSGEYYALTQSIEGFNFADMAWGTASAATITLSFLVRSSLTGTFGGALVNSATTRSYPFSYTISAANTWTTISITIPGDTTGTWVGATNGIGVRLYFDLGSGTTFKGTSGSWSGNYYLGATGATSVVGTNGATFYITGVQLEKGSTATSFDYRPYGTELALCQRYYQKIGDGGNPYAVLGVGRFASTTSASLRFPWSVVMRTTPTASFNSATYQLTDGVTARSVGAISLYSSGTDGVEGDIVTSSATSGAMTQLRGNAASPNAPFINLNAEL